MTELNAANSGTYEFDDTFKINRLGYGTMQLTGPGTWGPYKDPKQAESVVTRATELGINFFDTADSYGPWFADRYLAAGLKKAANHNMRLTRTTLKND